MFKILCRILRMPNEATPKSALENNKNTKLFF